MARREDRKPKENQKPVPAPLSLEQKKLKMREDIRFRFNKAFSHEDSAPIPNQRKK